MTEPLTRAHVERLISANEALSQVGGSAADETAKALGALLDRAEAAEEAAEDFRSIAVERTRERDAARAALGALLTATDATLTGLARGECEQHLHQTLAPRVGIARAALAPVEEPRHD